MCSLLCSAGKTSESMGSHCDYHLPLQHDDVHASSCSDTQV
jgi:hypothetical protein